MNERRTCPECNFEVKYQKCTNSDCNYRGIGWSEQQRTEAWQQHGEWDRTIGAQYDYTGRE